jgi:hypothetical protein
MSPVPTRTDQNNRRHRPETGDSDARPVVGSVPLIEQKTSIVIIENTPWAPRAERPKHQAPTARATGIQYRHSRRSNYPHSAQNHRA